MKKILIDAFKSDELKQHLEDVIAVDDKVPVEQLDEKLIIEEARYVLGKFTGASVGFEQEDDLAGKNGPEQRKWAKKNVAAIQKFLKKYEAACAG